MRTLALSRRSGADGAMSLQGAEVLALLQALHGTDRRHYGAYLQVGSKHAYMFCLIAREWKNAS